MKSCEIMNPNISKPIPNIIKRNIYVHLNVAIMRKHYS